MLNAKDNASVETLVTGIMELYPELKLKSKRGEQLRDIILSYYR